MIVGMVGARRCLPDDEADVPRAHQAGDGDLHRIFTSRPRFPTRAAPTLRHMNGPTRRILVVEDEPLINGALTDRLAAAGYDVVRAWDGPGAVAEFTANHPDLVTST
jgi:hypothetical protein